MGKSIKVKRSGGWKSAGIITAVIGAVSTVAAALIGTAWFPEVVGIKSGEIHVKRTVAYARIEYFRDARKIDSAFQAKTVGLQGSVVRKERSLFDEGLYVRGYYLKPHKSEKMVLQAHTSGITDVTPIIPPIAEFGVEAYDKSQGTSLSYQLNTKDVDYVLVAHHYYNGYQFSEKSGKYESDGGMHIDHLTDEAVLVFDFTALNYKALLKGEPKIWIREKQGEQPRQVPSTYNNGVIASDSIMSPPVGAHVYCDWEWASEDEQ